MNIYKSLILLLVLTACNSPRAVYDYDEKVQFQNFTTYNIYPELKSGLSQLDEDRLVEVIKGEMPSKGFAFSKEPEMYVNFHSEQYVTPSRNNIGIGVGGGGGNVGVGVSGGFPVGGSDTTIQITLDFIDAKNDALIWQAIVESSFNKNASPENRKAQLKSIIDKALKGYPPK